MKPLTAPLNRADRVVLGVEQFPQGHGRYLLAGRVYLDDLVPEHQSVGPAAERSAALHRARDVLRHDHPAADQSVAVIEPQHVVMRVVVLVLPDRASVPVDLAYGTVAASFAGHRQDHVVRHIDGRVGAAHEEVAVRQQLRVAGVEALELPAVHDLTIDVDQVRAVAGHRRHQRVAGRALLGIVKRQARALVR